METFYVIPRTGKRDRHRLTNDSKLVAGKLQAIRAARKMSLEKNRAKVVTYSTPRQVVREYHNGNVTSITGHRRGMRGPFKLIIK